MALHVGAAPLMLQEEDKRNSDAAQDIIFFSPLELLQICQLIDMTNTI